MENISQNPQNLNPYNINPNERLLILERKIDELIELNKKIHVRVDPPKWKKVVKFFLSHVFAIIAFGVLIYASWQIWDTLKSVSNNVDRVKSIVTDISSVFTEKWDSLSNQVDKLKLW